MPTNYPGGLDAFARPVPGEPRNVAPTETGSFDNAFDAIEAIQAELGTDPSGAAATVRARIVAAETATTDHLGDATDAHDASAISYAGSTNLVATNVEAALDELDAEKAATGHDHSGLYEPSGTVAAHEGAADPHPGYVTTAEGTTLISDHEGAADPHPGYTTAAELATAVGNHEGAADPHPTYTTAAELTTAVSNHEGAANPHTGYGRLGAANAWTEANTFSHTSGVTTDKVTSLTGAGTGVTVDQTVLNAFTLTWGDTSLGRLGANILGTSDAFRINGALLEGDGGSTSLYFRGESLYFGEAGDIRLHRQEADVLGLHGDVFRIYRSATTENTFVASVQTDTSGNERLQIQADGRLKWGPGNATQDTVLYRADADMLATDDWFSVTRGLGINPGVSTRIAGDAFPRVQLNANGDILWGDGSAATDTKLYRHTTNVLATDDAFWIKGGGEVGRLSLNEDRTGRYTKFTQWTKNVANQGGTEWVTWTDADGGVIGNRQWSLWGYPLKNADGTPGGFERFLTASFDTYDGVTTYTKLIEFDAAVAHRLPMMQAYVNHGNTTGAKTIDAGQISGSSANVHRVVLTGNVTFTFANARSGFANSLTIMVVQDGTGGRTVTWPGSVLWPGGTTPTLTSTANKQDVFTFMTVDGITWFGYVVGQNSG